MRSQPEKRGTAAGAAITAALLLAALAGRGAASVADRIPYPGLDGISLPEGFGIEVYAPDVPGARSLCLGNEGRVFVGTRDIRLPEMELGPRVTALGMRFCTGEMFPAEYGSQIFIAKHGSWNRSTPIGYRVMLVRLEDGETVSCEVFAEGWLTEEGAFGRPVDVQVVPGGALLVSDDRAGRIYRIHYGG